MCCDARVCSAQGKGCREPMTRHTQCLLTSITHCNSGKSERASHMKEWSQ
jgi:hypothetical protein